MPKEMLPVVDKPAIQYVVEEAVKVGLSDVLMITGRNKRALEDHFDRVPALEATLEAKGDTAKLESIQAASNLGDIHYVRQGDPKGLGHAVLRARQHVGYEPFAVLLVQAKTGGSVVALIEVEPSQISAYGCADISEIDGEGFVRINKLVEKPDVNEAPSNLAVIGRYVLHPDVFDVLEKTEPGRGGEIQLTDALQELASRDGEGGGVYGVVFRGRRYDTGDKLSYLKACVELAIDSEDLGPGLRAWLPEIAARLSE
jgi:UTP--glucose-1-phosphate uridylyltransferase